MLLLLIEQADPTIRQYGHGGVGGKVGADDLAFAPGPALIIADLHRQILSFPVTFEVGEKQPVLVVAI